MNILIFGLVVFVGLFLATFGLLERKPIFSVGGLFILMLAGTAVADSGISYSTGTAITDYGNGTILSTNEYTTIGSSDWLIVAIARVLFFGGLFGSLVEFLVYSGKTTQMNK